MVPLEASSIFGKIEAQEHSTVKEKPALTLDFRQLYAQFDAPVTPVDCGALCAPHNPTGKPFCCDICQAVPVVYREEWQYLQHASSQWHIWRGDECPGENTDPQILLEDTPEYMLLLACQGPAHCHRGTRAVSCRQFPFMPYITMYGEFIGMVYYWDFEPTCWVISHLERVTQAYREEFIQLYDRLFKAMPEDLESYAICSTEMRDAFIERRRRIPLLHRNGGYYLLSPASERLTCIPPEKLPRFGPYKS